MKRRKRTRFGATLGCGTALFIIHPAPAADIPTSQGSGADTYLSNDDNSGPNVSHGADGALNLRYWDQVRMRHLMTRFDLSELSEGADLSMATLSMTFTDSNRGRTVQVYGLVDESLDEWDEATTAYANAPGVNFDAGTNVLGTFNYDIFDATTNPSGKWQLLGDFTVTNGAEPFTDTSDPATLNLDSFLSADTNGLVSFLVVWGGDNGPSWWIASKEEGVNPPPTLGLPNAGFADSDGDGLGDVWEDQFFGNNDGVITQEELDLQSGDDDFDEDEFDNLAEFNAGSDPTDFFSIPGDIDGDELLDLWEDEHFGNFDGVPTEAELALQSGFDDPDADFDTNTEEMENGTNPNDQFSFLDNENGDGTGDGLPDNWEFFYFGDTSTATSSEGDVDGDGFANFDEFLAGSDPDFDLSIPTDIDADGVPDLWEDQHYGNNDGIIQDADLTGTDGSTDFDEDGFTELEESTAEPVPSDPNDPASVPDDADGDGLSDSWELTFFFDIFEQDGNDDSDGDLYTNAEEFNASTDPIDRLSFPGDSDGDGLNDRWEELYFDGDLDATNDGENDSDGDGSSDLVEYESGSNPNDADSVPGDIDGDGLLDDDEIFYFGDIFTYDGDDDPDRDFATNREELDAGTDPTVRTFSPDEDLDGFGDGLGDDWEIFSFGSTDVTDDPDGDADGDDFTNFEEYAAATNGNDPLSTPDEDGDGLPDGWELFHFILEGEDPVTDRETILARQTGADDFDGDGASNELELLSGTNPNDVNDVPNPAIVSTAIGLGADTFLSNDNQNAASAPTVVHGGEATGEIRDNRASRLKIGMIRFDISQLSGDLSDVALRINTTFSGNGNPGAVTVYGMVDGDPGELWDEASTSYSNAPGILEDERDVISLFARDPQKLRLLGTIDLQPTGVNLSDPNTLDLQSFLEDDTDGVVTIFLHPVTNNGWFGFTTKEGNLDLAPALVVPNGELTLPSEIRIEAAVLDRVADTFTMTVTGLVIGEDYHVESSANLAAFTPVAGSTFTAAATTEEVVTPADQDVDTMLFFRVSDGAEP